MPYHCNVNVHQLILTGDGRKIIKPGDVLDVPKLRHGHTGEIPYAPLDAHQGNTVSADIMGLPLPPGNTPLNLLGPVSRA